VVPSIQGLPFNAQNDHIALYAYHLPPHLGIQAYATFLDRIPPKTPEGG
jgi:hypothetical protein